MGENERLKLYKIKNNNSNNNGNNMGNMDKMRERVIENPLKSLTEIRMNEILIIKLEKWKKPLINPLNTTHTLRKRAFHSYSSFINPFLSL
jgi:hypothetical protein